MFSTAICAIVRTIVANTENFDDVTCTLQYGVDCMHLAKLLRQRFSLKHLVRVSSSVRKDTPRMLSIV